MQVDLRGALAADNIRINGPSTFTVALDTDPVMMDSACERLLGLDALAIEELASEIIFAELRLVVAQMEIEENIKGSETFEKNIRELVRKELSKIGMKLVNVNIPVQRLGAPSEGGFIKGRLLLSPAPSTA